ncbi:MAG: monofunctional biosynthetic peptidoglycan transglycosylase [Casimicrobiaceae bacterium]|nr:monofunctional biosynthetic peptidoglycan transglycosylase [Casimicrobiaceae bacterium]MCX8097414.1 monofunctional biosynthetic peptidoglycan transglycosylase [Casimicrobiaceae bacterium]MDW8312048.1 monofunctional biosynthetic peptidoglycan transglycosylase [Burkholderiales bacterium]
MKFSEGLAQAVAAFKAVVFGAALLFIGLQLYFLLMIVWYAKAAPSRTAFMAHRMSELAATQSTVRLRYQWVPYERISVHLKRAIIAAEDAKFVDHEGFDWEGIQQALEKNRARGRTVAGGSTISQQLAKNLFLTPTRSYGRKLQEALITVMLETLLPKQRILELYLNVIEWGEGVFGAEAAARRYWNVSALQLTREQAARLAAMAPNPRYYERNPGAPGLKRKTAIILARMASAELPDEP